MSKHQGHHRTCQGRKALKSCTEASMVPVTGPRCTQKPPWCLLQWQCAHTSLHGACYNDNVHTEASMVPVPGPRCTQKPPWCLLQGQGAHRSLRGACYRTKVHTEASMVPVTGTRCTRRYVRTRYVTNLVMYNQNNLKLTVHSVFEKIFRNWPMIYELSDLFEFSELEIQDGHLKITKFQCLTGDCSKIGADNPGSFRENILEQTNDVWPVTFLTFSRSRNPWRLPQNQLLVMRLVAQTLTCVHHGHCL